MYHIAFARYGKKINVNWLCLDLIGQNIGLICGTSQTIMGPTSPFILVPLASLSMIADLSHESQRNLVYVSNATNMLVTSLVSVKIMGHWIVVGVVIHDRPSV